MIRVGYASATAIGVVGDDRVEGQFQWRAKTGVATLVTVDGTYTLTSTIEPRQVRRNEIEVTGRDRLGTLVTWLVTRDPRRGCCGAK